MVNNFISKFFISRIAGNTTKKKTISSFQDEMTKKCFGIIFCWLTPLNEHQAIELPPRPPADVRRFRGYKTPAKSVLAPASYRGAASLRDCPLYPGLDELLKDQPSSSELLDHQPGLADLLANQPTPTNLLQNISFSLPPPAKPGRAKRGEDDLL